MRHRNPRSLRVRTAIGKVIPHDRRSRLLAICGKLDVAMIPIGSEALGCPVGRKGHRRRPLPVLTLTANIGKLDMSDPLGNRPERCPCPDRLKLLVIADKNDLCTARRDLLNEAGKLSASHHARLVDDEHIATTDDVPVVLPASRPGRQCPALNTGTFLQSLRRLAGQCSPVNLITLTLPGLACCSQHGRLASTRKPDHGCDALRSGDMRDRQTLFVRKPGKSITSACPDRRILFLYRPVDMTTINTMITPGPHP